MVNSAISQIRTNLKVTNFTTLSNAEVESELINTFSGSLLESARMTQIEEKFHDKNINCYWFALAHLKPELVNSPTHISFQDISKKIKSSAYQKISKADSKKGDLVVFEADIQVLVQSRDEYSRSKERFVFKQVIHAAILTNRAESFIFQKDSRLGSDYSFSTIDDAIKIQSKLNSNGMYRSIKKITVQYYRNK